ncbi:hypothetical protein [Luteimonas terricola]|uniref:Uncharacterized protein n=1 Tax=Luteimonas terricola TaxID=645597 RepID=A0ABQ2EA66_9GAMM|nr:hypothetical protein [Luteimonas terricola]GGK03083.1 hypothetical protein GCM10011394_10240 [Luteimonas terricola]
MSGQRARDSVGADTVSAESAKCDPSAGTVETSVYRLDLEQLDAMDRLLRIVAAHGDIVATIQAAELVPGTLPVIGQLIHDHARALREILDQVEAHHPRQAHGRRDGVDEVRAGYIAGPLRLVAGGQRTRLH